VNRAAAPAGGSDRARGTGRPVGRPPSLGGAAPAPGRAIQLRVSHVWRQEVMADAVLTEPAPVTLGSSRRSTLIVPDVGLPPEFAIIRPGARGYVLTLAEGMGGRICVGGEEMEVADFLAGAGGDGAAAVGGFRATPIGGADWGVVELDGDGEHVFFFQFATVDPPLPLSHWDDSGLLAPAFAFAIIIHAIFLLISYQLRDGGDLLVFPGRANLMTTYLVKRPPPPEPPEPKTSAPAASTDGDKVKVKSATKGKEGKAGGEGDKPRARDPDAIEEEIDPAIEVGLLKQENRTMIKEVVQHNLDDTLKKFVALSGDKREGGKGFGKGKGIGVGDAIGGSGTRGDSDGRGRGGGGSADKDFQSQGKIDTGETRAPKGTGGTGSKEVAVVGIGSPTGDLGGLSREEVERVIKSRSGLIRACYQRELDKTRGLSGKLSVTFTIGADGTVKAARVDPGKSSLRNAEVESCVKRQIQKLRFPAKGGGVVNYPFIFSQG
jgi:hypothetical protein